MSLSRPNFAGFSHAKGAQHVGCGMSSPMSVEIARDSADTLGVPQAVLACESSRENSNGMAFTATPTNACNCVFRYPSQRSWPGIVPTAPAAPSFRPYFLGKNARVIADHVAISARRLPARQSVACSRRTQKGTRGSSRCEFSKLRRSQRSPSVALQPVATQRWSKVCWAQAPVQAQPLSRAATPKPVPSSARAQTCFIAKPTPANATDLTAATFGSQPWNSAIKTACGFGGFLLPKPVRATRMGQEPEGTFDVQ